MLVTLLRSNLTFSFRARLSAWMILPSTVLFKPSGLMINPQARCYHARACGLHKSNCQYVCEADRDGLDLETLDGRPFLAVNGTQTLSYTIGNLVAELDGLRDMGIRRFRLSPQDVDMVAVAVAYRAVLDGRLDAGAALARLAELAAFAPFSNGFYRGREGAALIGADPLRAE